MEITTDKTQEFIVLRINGRVDTTNYNEFEKFIGDIIKQKENNIVLDCKDMNYISSSGLRVFLITQKRLMASKGKLHICNMQATIKEIFDISGFSTIFKIFDTESEALGA